MIINNDDKTIESVVDKLNDLDYLRSFLKDNIKYDTEIQHIYYDFKINDFSLIKNPGHNMLKILIKSDRINELIKTYGLNHIKELSSYVNRAGIDKINNVYEKLLSESVSIKDITQSNIPIFLAPTKLLQEYVNSFDKFENKVLVNYFNMYVKELISRAELLQPIESANELFEIKKSLSYNKPNDLYEIICEKLYKCVINNNISNNKFFLESERIINKYLYKDAILDDIIFQINNNNSYDAAEKMFFQYFSNSFDSYDFVINKNNYDLIFQKYSNLNKSLLYLDSINAAYELFINRTKNLLINRTININYNNIIIKEDVKEFIINVLLEKIQLFKKLNIELNSKEQSLYIKELKTIVFNINSLKTYKSLNNNKSIQKRQ